MNINKKKQGIENKIKLDLLLELKMLLELCRCVVSWFQLSTVWIIKNFPTSTLKLVASS